MSVQHAVPLVCLLVSSLVALTSYVWSFRFDGAPRRLPLQDDVERALRWRGGVAAALALVLLFWLTRFREDPFSSGQGLGVGLIVGGAFTLVAWCLRAHFLQRLASFVESGPVDRRISAQALRACAKHAAGELGLAIMPVAVILWQIRDDPTSALMGCALGVLVVRILLGFASLGLGRMALAEEALGVFGVALAVVSALAVMHDNPGGAETTSTAQRHLFWMLPLLVATMMTIVAMITNRLLFADSGDGRRPVLIATIAATVLNLVAMTYLTMAIYKSPALLSPLAAGVLLSCLLVALITSAPMNSARRGALGFVVAGLVLGVWAESFRRLAGYGVALSSLGALSTSGLVVAMSLAAGAAGSQDSERVSHWTRLAQSLTLIVGLLVTVSLARIFLTNVPLRTADLSVFSHYLLIGLALGVVAPLLLLASRSEFTVASVTTRSVTREVMAAGAIGLSVLVLVVLTPLCFRARASAGMMVGLVIAQTVTLFLAFSGQFAGHGPPRGALPPVSLFTLGCAVLGAQLGPLLAAHSGWLQRPHKLGLTSVLLFTSFLWFAWSGKSDSARPAGDRS